MTESPNRLTLAAFAGAVVIGGSNFVAVRYSNRELPPMFGAGARFALAALLLFAVVALGRQRLPRGRHLGVAVVYGLLAFTVTYALAYYALQTLSAGTAAVIFSATPLITLGLVALHRLEPITRHGVAGSLLAVVGIVILADPFSSASVPLLPMVAVIGAAIAAAESSVILKLVPPPGLMATNAVAMGSGAVLLLGISAVAGESWLIPHDSETWVALGYLVVLGSMGLFGLVLFTLERWTASAVAYITVLMPVVAMVVGYFVAGESVGANGIVGGAIVIASVYVGALRTDRPRQDGYCQVGC